MKEIEELEEELQFAIANGGAISAIKRDLANAKKEEEQLELDFDAEVDAIKRDLANAKKDEEQLELEFEPAPFNNTNSDEITIGYDVLKIDKNPDADTKVEDTKVDETE